MIRVILHQPALAKYRIPVFRELAGRPGIDLVVRYASIRHLPHSDAEGFRAEPVRVRGLGPGGRTLYWAGEQARDADPARADVVVYPWNSRYLSIHRGLARAGRLGVGTVLWGHGYSKAERGWALRLRRSMASRSDAVLFYNHTQADRFTREEAWDPDRVFVALNTIDQSPIRAAREHWSGDNGALGRFAAERGIDPDRTVIFVSRLMADNRVDLLIDAAALLGERAERFRAVVVGDGPESGRLRAHASARGVADRVVFAGAIYEERELAPWMMNAAAFCYPQNVGLSLIHGFAYGLPVVTSDRIEGQNPEIEALRDNENGLLYRHGDVEALARTLERVVTDRTLRSRLAHEASRTAREDFTLERMVDGMEAAIRCAHERRRRGR